jgi:H+/gluconate symporter-like permease
MKLEVRNISVGSLVVSSLPLVVFTIALLGGVVTFMLMPNPQYAPMSAAHKLLAVGLFSLLYAMLVSALFVFIAFIYNILTGVLGMKGVCFELEEVHDHE